MHFVLHDIWRTYYSLWLNGQTFCILFYKKTTQDYIKISSCLKAIWNHTFSSTPVLNILKLPILYPFLDFLFKDMKEDLHSSYNILHSPWNIIIRVITAKTDKTRTTTDTTNIASNNSILLMCRTGTLALTACSSVLIGSTGVRECFCKYVRVH